MSGRRSAEQRNASLPTKLLLLFKCVDIRQAGRQTSALLWTSDYRRSSASKLDELQDLLDSNDVTIAVIVETWLHDDIDSKILELSGYTLFRLDRRDGRQGGGVAVYVKHGCYCTPLSHLTHTNLEVL